MRTDVRGLGRPLPLLTLLHDKDGFPTRRVYEGEPGRAVLRLITCGGAFDGAGGRYTANVVVYARLVG
ncbi:hypothetical protein GCM10023224_00980 [Streptomonospora halophila]|uniref:Sortase family protein n=1 Tax=Streptomonospora halophila TaxID=427369 RepID=A0ABP9G1Y5_9ACTN